MASRFQAAPGLTTEDRRYSGKVRFRADRLGLPARRTVPTVYALWTDLFHEAVSDEDIDRAFEIIFISWQHTFLILTKRAERMRRFVNDFDVSPGNVWYGVTVCNQAEADAKIPLLLKTPAAHRFISVEPMLGPVNLNLANRFCPECGSGEYNPVYNASEGCRVCKDCHQEWFPDVNYGKALSGIDWVVCGPENGPGKRPFDPAWAARLEADCRAANVPIFFKCAGFPQELPWMVK
jgi:protein gp37